MLEKKRISEIIAEINNYSSKNKLYSSDVYNILEIKCLIEKKDLYSYLKLDIVEDDIDPLIIDKLRCEYSKIKRKFDNLLVYEYKSKIILKGGGNECISFLEGIKYKEIFLFTKNNKGSKILINEIPNKLIELVIEI